MNTRLECTDKLQPNVPLTIVERDNSGMMVGFWRGYWNPNRGTVQLYPAHHPSCYWQVKRYKHAVSDRAIYWLWKAPEEKKAPPTVEEIPKAVKRRVHPFPGKDAKPPRLEGQMNLDITKEG